MWDVRAVRSWRPHVTFHAILRYLQRVQAIPIADHEVRTLPAVLAEGGLTLKAVRDIIWPSSIALPGDPGCSFVLRRDGFEYVVNGGKVVTVQRPNGPRRPRPVAPRDEFD
jgi:hypothetical protein